MHTLHYLEDPISGGSEINHLMEGNINFATQHQTTLITFSHRDRDRELERDTEKENWKETQRLKTVKNDRDRNRDLVRETETVNW